MLISITDSACQVVATNELNGEPLFGDSIGSTSFTVTTDSNNEPVVTFANDARVIVRDITAVNGVIHILSDVAGMWFTKRTQNSWKDIIFFPEIYSDSCI